MAMSKGISIEALIRFTQHTAWAGRFTNNPGPPLRITA